MRPACAILGLATALLLSGCNREPSFDERYAGAEQTIRKKAAEIDAELAAANRLASEAAAAAPTAAPRAVATEALR